MPTRDSGLPGATDEVGSAPSGRSRIARWMWAAVLLTVMALTLRPLGFSGRGLVVTVLLAINFGVFAIRLVPEDRVPPRLLLPLMGTGVAAAAAVIAVAHSGTSPLFAFFLAAYIGYRLDVRTATVLAVVLSVLCGLALVLRAGAGQHGLYLMAGLSTGALVLPGMSEIGRAHV